MSDRHLVISSDCHAGLPQAEYRAYVDPQYHDAFDMALPIQDAEMDRMSEKFLIADINRSWREGREGDLAGAWDLEARNRVLDGDGIAGEIVFPDGITEKNTPPFGAGLGLPCDERIIPELQWAGARAHNRWLAEFIAQDPARRVGVAIVPALWDIEDSVKEVEWARKNGLGGILIPSIWGSHAPYHHPRYNPLWEACEANNVVIHLHSGPAPMSDYFGSLSDPNAPDLPGAMGIFVTEVVWWAARPLTFMIWGGVFERYPKLKLAITESTTVWVPEYLTLMNQRYEETHFSAKLGDYRSHLSMKPSDYFARNVALGASCMPRREAELRHDIGLTRIMWGSDYPHPEGSWPYTSKQMTDTFGGLPEADIEKMIGGNAAEFYGFDTDALASIAARIGPEKSLFRGDAAA